MLICFGTLFRSQLFIILINCNHVFILRCRLPCRYKLRSSVCVLKFRDLDRACANVHAYTFQLLKFCYACQFALEICFGILFRSQLFLILINSNGQFFDIPLLCESYNKLRSSEHVSMSRFRDLDRVYANTQTHTVIKILSRLNIVILLTESFRNTQPFLINLHVLTCSK